MTDDKLDFSPLVTARLFIQLKPLNLGFDPFKHFGTTEVSEDGETPHEGPFSCIHNNLEAVWSFDLLMEAADLLLDLRMLVFACSSNLRNLGRGCDFPLSCSFCLAVDSVSWWKFATCSGASCELQQMSSVVRLCACKCVVYRLSG